MDRATSSFVFYDNHGVWSSCLWFKGMVTIMGRNEKAFAIPLMCGFLGVVLAIATQLLYDAGIIIDTFVTGTITLREIQVIIIILWILVGVIIASTQS